MDTLMKLRMEDFKSVRRILRKRIRTNLLREIEMMRDYKFDKAYFLDAIDVIEYNYIDKVKESKYLSETECQKFVRIWIRDVINNWGGLEYFQKVEVQ